MAHLRLARVIALAMMTTLAIITARPTSAQVAQFRQIARFVNEPSGSNSPDGRFVAIGGDSILLYNVATKQRHKIADGGGFDLGWSSHMNRIVWLRTSDGPNGAKATFVWTMALDSSSGRPTGAPQRVSIGPASSPSVSMDGRMIAYVGDDGPAPTNGSGSARFRLVAINATGGPEQLLARSPDGLDTPHWSRNGKSIYVAGTLADGNRAVVNKVFLDGRAPQVIRGDEREWLVGLTSDRTRIITAPSGSPVASGARAVVLDTTGKELWSVPLPEGTIAQWDGIISDSILVWENSINSVSLVIRPIAGGALRRPPLIGESNHAPTWSPDGRQISFLVQTGLRSEVAVMNADGSNVRRFAGTDSWSPARWSPDSRYLGMLDKGGRTFRLLDVATLKSTIVLRDSTVVLGTFVWTASGKSVVVPFARPSKRGENTIEELFLTGEHRKLVSYTELPGTPATSSGWSLNADRSIVIRSDSGVFVLPSAGGAFQRVAITPGYLRSAGLAVSPDGAWLAAPTRDVSKGSFGQLELTSLRTGEHKVLSLPFWFLQPMTPQFTPDGRAVLIAGRQLSDSSGSNLYLAPTDGSPARRIANLGLPANARFALSPDGRWVVHTVHRESVSTLLAVDLRNPKR